MGYPYFWKHPYCVFATSFHAFWIITYSMAQLLWTRLILRAGDFKQKNGWHGSSAIFWNSVWRPEKLHTYHTLNDIFGFFRYLSHFSTFALLLWCVFFSQRVPRKVGCYFRPSFRMAGRLMYIHMLPLGSLSFRFRKVRFKIGKASVFSRRNFEEFYLALVNLLVSSCIYFLNLCSFCSSLLSQSFNHQQPSHRCLVVVGVKVLPICCHHLPGPHLGVGALEHEEI